MGNRSRTNPAGAFVAIRTDWSKRWPDAARMENKDANGIAHYPGWGLPAWKHLSEQRKIIASGHETTDTDPGVATSKDNYSLETYILSTNHYQIELLTKSRSGPGSWRNRRSKLSKTKRRLRVSSAGVCDFALNLDCDGPR
jgi:kynurenine formamidase